MQPVYNTALQAPNGPREGHDAHTFCPHNAQVGLQQDRPYMGVKPYKRW